MAAQQRSSGRARRLGWSLLWLVLAGAAAVTAQVECDTSGNLTEVEATEWRRMAELYNATGGPSWLRSACWSPSVPRRVCGSPPWEHVACYAGRVWRMVLNINRLSGTLPGPGWGEGLDYLSQMSIGNNEYLGGAFPSEWAPLPSLAEIEANSCAFTSMPTNVTGLVALTSLSLSDNLLSGTLSSRFSGLDSLTDLYLDANVLSGGFPSRWSGLGALEALDVSKCPLGGTLPERVAGLPSLGELVVVQCELEGPVRVPRGLPSLTSLSASLNLLEGPLDPANFVTDGGGQISTVDLTDNPTIGGRLEDAANWTGVGESLFSLSLRRCGLSGTLPAQWHGFNQQFMGELNLDGNAISGTVPSSWSGLEALHTLSLGVTRVSGTLPVAWSGLGNMGFLSFDSAHALSGTLPRQFVNLDGLVSISLAFTRVSGVLPGGAITPSLEFLSVEGTLVSGELPTVYEPPTQLTALSAARTRLSGPFFHNARWRGCDRLANLDVSHCDIGGTIGGVFPLLAPGRVFLAQNRVSGTWPAGDMSALAPAPLSVLNLSDNLISGEFDPMSLAASPSNRTLAEIYLANNPIASVRRADSWDGLPALTTLDMHNCGFGGDLYELFGAVTIVSTLVLRENRLSGVLPHDAFAPMLGRCVSAPGAACLATLDLGFNLISGEIPGILFSGTVQELDLTHNRFSSLGPPPDDMPVADDMSSISFAHNLISGAFPDYLCRAAGERLTLDLSHNLLTSVPRCVSARFAQLLLDDNLLEELPDDFLGSASVVLTVSARNNRIADTRRLRADSSEDGVGGPDPPLQSLDLSGCPLREDVSTTLLTLASSLPRLDELRLRDCNLAGEMLLARLPGLRVLDLSGNPAITFHNSGDELGYWLANGREVDLSRLDIRGVTGFPRALRVLRRADTFFSDCPTTRLLRSSTLSLLDIRGAALSTTASKSGNGPACRERVLGLLATRSDQIRSFPEIGLICPQWETAASGALVQADANFVAYHRCECVGLKYWNRERLRCEECPSGRDGRARGGGGGSSRAVPRIQCDQRADFSAHAALGNYYPVLPETGRMPERADDLVRAVMIECRLPNACNTADAYMADVRPGDPLMYGCARGRVKSALLCSRCERGLWPSGSACLDCHPAFGWLVPLSLAATAAGALAVLWRRSGVPDDGVRTVTAAVLWFQLGVILEQSNQQNLGSSAQSTTTWAWLEHARASLSSWVVLRPWALECVRPTADYLTGAAVSFAVPAVVLAAGAVLGAALPRRAASRAVYVAVWLLASFFLPTTMAALSLFNCEESAGGHRFLSAAPYVACDVAGDRRFALARRVAAAVLACYSLPMLPALLWLARFRYRCRAAAADPAAQQLDEPLLAVEEPRPARRLEALLAPAGELFLAPLRDPVRWWWGVAYDLSRKWALALVVGLVPARSALLPVFVFLVLLLSLLAHSQQVSWQHRADNVLEVVVLAASLGIYLLGIVSGVRARGQDDDGDVSGDSEGSSQRAARVVVSVIHLCVFSALGATVYAVWARRRRRRKRKERAAAAAAGADAAAAASVAKA